MGQLRSKLFEEKMDGGIGIKNTRSRYLDIFPTTDTTKSFYYSIVNHLYGAKIEQEYQSKHKRNISPREKMREMEVILKKDFLMPEGNFTNLSIDNEEEENIYTAPCKFDTKRYETRSKNVEKLYKLFLDMEMPKENTLEEDLIEKGIDGSLDELEAREALQADLELKGKLSHSFEDKELQSCPTDVRTEKARNAGVPVTAFTDELSLLDPDSIYKDPVSNMINCGLKLSEIQFVCLNARKHDFTLNLLGLFADKVYTIQCAIGENVSKKLPRRSKVINILKISVNQQNFCKSRKIKENEVVKVLRDGNFNENQSEKEMEELISYSETRDEEIMKEKVKERLHKTIQNKTIKRDKNFKDFLTHSQRQEAKLQISLYFGINNLDLFARQINEAEETGKKWYAQRSYCQRCLFPFYSDSKKKQDHEAECRGSKVTIGREICAHETSKYQGIRGVSFNQYKAKEPAPVTIFAGEFALFLFELKQVKKYILQSFRF